MKIIVVGGGKVGTALCRSLVAENHDVILIEKDESVLNHITKRFDIIGISNVNSVIRLNNVMLEI